MARKFSHETEAQRARRRGPRRQIVKVFEISKVVQRYAKLSCLHVISIGLSKRKTVGCQYCRKSAA